MTAVNHDGIGLSIASGHARATGQIDAHLTNVGCAQITHRNDVRSTARSKIDVLHVFEIHRNVAHVPEETYALAVRRDIDVLAHVGAEELHGVGARAPLHYIAAVSGVPDKSIVACAQQS